MTSCTDSTVELILGETPHLRGVARRLARCESDVDDLVQDTLLKSYKARDRFRPGTSVRAWTSTILRRVFITNTICAKRRRVQTDTDAGEPLDVAVGRTSSSFEDPPSDVHAFGESLDDVVKDAFDAVPEIYRTSFFLSAIQGLSCAEIGMQLRVPVGTVMSRVHRARECLRVGLADRRGTSPSRAGRPAMPDGQQEALGGARRHG